MIHTALPRFLAAALLAASLGSTVAQTVQDNGVVRVKSAYNVDDTIARLKADIAAKGIRFVTQDEGGDVWAVYTDFNWIAQRHGITNRGEQFKTASGVVASITSAVTK